MKVKIYFPSSSAGKWQKLFFETLAAALGSQASELKLVKFSFLAVFAFISIDLTRDKQVL